MSTGSVAYGGESRELQIPGTTSTAGEFEAAGALVEAWCQRETDRVLAAAKSLTSDELILAIDRLLTSVINLSTAGSLVFQVHPEADVREAARKASEQAGQALNGFFLRRDLFDALEAGSPPVAPSGARAREKILLQMRRAGVQLADGERARLKSLSDEIEKIQNQYMENLAKFQRSIALDQADELAGLPADYREKHPAGPDGKIHITTSYPDALPVLTYAEDPEVRVRMLDAFATRAFPENTPVLEQLRERRREYASLLAYPDFATYIIEDKMVRTPAEAWKLIERVDRVLAPPAQRDVGRIRDRKRKDPNGGADLLPEDVGGGVTVGYYEDKLRSETFAVDAKALRAYFPYATVRAGLFGLCEELFGIQIISVTAVEKWHPSVEAFDVVRDGRPLGRFFLDMVPREGKFSHAAQFDLRLGVEGRQLPQAVLVCNFVQSTTDPAGSLMAYNDVVTFFHESGHLLHAIFAGHTPYIVTSNLWVETDFMEAPSMLFEEWAREPALLLKFTKHWKTGEPLPRELAERMLKSSSFARGLHWRSQIAYSAASLAMYERDPKAGDAYGVMQEMTRKYELLPRSRKDHMECGWMHLTGYSALYYTYTWSLVIARDLLRRFHDAGSLLDPDVARQYADRILAPGGSAPPMDLVRNFLGREMSFDAFEKWITFDAMAY